MKTFILLTDDDQSQEDVGEHTVRVVGIRRALEPSEALKQLVEGPPWFGRPWFSEVFCYELVGDGGEPVAHLSVYASRMLERILPALEAPAYARDDDVSWERPLVTSDGPVRPCRYYNPRPGTSSFG